MSHHLVMCLDSLVPWSLFISTIVLMWRFNVFKVCFWDASWFDLVHSFWDGCGLNKKWKDGKRLLFSNPLRLFYVYWSSTLNISLMHMHAFFPYFLYWYYTINKSISKSHSITYIDDKINSFICMEISPENISKKCFLVFFVKLISLTLVTG